MDNNKSITKIYINIIIIYRIMKVKVVLEEQEEGGYTVYAPSLPGCISQGENRKDALRNIKEAIELYLDTNIDEVIEHTGEMVTITV